MDKYGNYLGILKWSLAQNDGTKPSEVKPLNDEDKAFFEKAVEAACESDASRMKKCLDVLLKEDTSDEKRIELLEILEEFLESLDNAVDFDTMKGYQSIQNLLLTTTNNDIKKACISLITTATQNQPKVQKVLVECNLIQDLLKFMGSDSDSLIKAKAISCIMAIIDHYEAGQKVFLFNNGLNILKKILFDDKSSMKLIQKALTLVLILAREETPYMRKYLSAEFVNRIVVAFLVHENIDIKETSLYLIDYIINMERKSFAKEEVANNMQKVLPALQKYVSDVQVPSEIKQCVASMEAYLKL